MKIPGIWWHGWWGSTVPPREVRTTGQKIQGVVEQFVKDVARAGREEATKQKRELELPRR